MNQVGRGPALADMTRITDPIEAMEILRSVDVSAELHRRDSSPLLHDSVLTLRGSAHLERRRIETRLMLRDALRNYEEAVLAPGIHRRLDRLAAAPRRPDGFVRDDLLVFTRTILVEMTARMIGLDDVDNEDEIEALHECAQLFGEAASVEWSRLDHDEIVRSGLRASGEFVERWFTASLTRRQAIVDRWRAGMATEQDLPMDLITMLLVHAPDLSVEEIRREAIFFLLASSNTTTHAAPHVVLELLDWISRHPDDEALLGDLEFVRQAVNEGLRLHPPVPALLKRSLKEMILSTGRVLREGEYLAIDLDAANSDASTFGDNPLEFNPRRVSVGQPYGLSFGAGPHACLGRPLATSTSKSKPEDSTIGALVRLVLELMGVGVRLDPATGPPVLRDDTTARRFGSFPVIFTRL